MSDSISAVRELLLIAAFRDPSQPPPERLAAIIADIDWEMAVRFAKFHLLEPALWQLASHIESLPASAKDGLRAAVQTGSARNLILGAATAQLTALLNESGIESLILKGPVLAEEAYGDLSRRWFSDVDVLVRQAEALKAIAALESAGFTSVVALDEGWRRRYLQRFYELSFRDRRGVSIDLHWSLLDSQFSFCPSEVDAWTNTRVVNVRGVPIRTLSTEMTAKYLCLHVSKHHWDRLGWLADIAHWIERVPGVDWGLLAGDPATGRFVMITLGLIERLAGTRLPSVVFDRIRRDTVVTAQIASVESRLIRSPTPAVTQTPQWRTEYARAMPLSNDRWRSLCSTLFRPSILEWQAVPLPQVLSPLYAVIRPWRLAWKRVRR
jgi:hypothetical protein